MRRSPCYIAFAVLTVSALSAPSPSPSVPIDKPTVLKAITIFRDDPESELGHAAGAVILQFAEQSHDVLVTVNAKIVPLGNNKIPMRYRSTLLVAFTAGDVDSQLLRHQKKDDSYAGALQMIETYRQLQQKHRKLRIAEVEHLIELEKQGKLKAYVATR